MTNLNPVAVQETDLETAAAVHRQIPEFEPDYIERYYEAKAALNDPFIIVAYINSKPAGYMIGFNRSGSLYMWLAGVIPGYRRHHVFAYMTAALEHEAIRRQKARITVKTDERFPAMVKALDELGFHVDEKNDNAIHLSKTLS